MTAIDRLQVANLQTIKPLMSVLNDDQSRSSMEETTASQQPVRPESNGEKIVRSRSDARYWLEPRRLFKNRGSAEYSCRFSVRGHKTHFTLGTANKKTAAAKAAEIYTFVQSHGWEAAMDRYKPKPKKKDKVTTVGQFIETASQISTARTQSLNAYAKSFRKIVSDIKDIPGAGKFIGCGDSPREWRDKVDAVELAAITPAEVTAWKNKRLREAEGDPLAKRRTVVTVNSLIRNAKALFGKKILPFVGQTLTLPSPLPFDGVSMEKGLSMRYVSKIDPYAILAKAKEDMAESNPEGFKVMILALVCGMRRSEIDNLLWRAFDFPGSAIRVESSEFHELKSEDSAGVIDLDADTLALFRGYRAKHPTSTFVIESPHPHRKASSARYYRCNAVFKTVLEWLRAQGVETSKPLHTLRKEIGSVIASEHGIFEASRYLRHSDIRITSAIYADKKKTITPKTFAGLLGNPAAATDGEFGRPLETEQNRSATASTDRG
jgi:integrase